MAAEDSQFPENAPGWPDRSPDLDALPGFRDPPPGYGQVPFWWWSGGDLDVERLLWQVRELHAMGISGFQVNYSHTDTPGWPTDDQSPELFTDDWWQVYSRVSALCGELGMGIGLSTYTLDWPNGADNLFYRLFYSKPELNAIELVVDDRQRVSAGQVFQKALDSGGDAEAACHAVRAYELKHGELLAGGIDITPAPDTPELQWTAPQGDWEVWTFRAARHEGTLNPLKPGAGDTVVAGFYQEFQNHATDGSANGLNYFFNDELKVGVGKFAWHDDFAEQFRTRKGYDLFEVLPALWQDLGDITPKVRIDYADVRMSLMEERYFEPIYGWHADRGIIYGCDNHGRGFDPDAYGDYFRACRWYSAPGHDTPGGNADVIKGKVSSSIANLYRRPRVQLEGYHSLGWGATPENLMFATRENYLYGCNLFSLHGFYSTTFGSHWEWAPPSYFFRMPYWPHMQTFLQYFDRLSYLMSQGHHVCDVAVIYPVTPYEAEMDGDAARDAAFDVGRELMQAGINFDFIDHQSLARAEVQNRCLVIADVPASYQALVIPNMRAVRWTTLERAAEFAEAGGLVYRAGDAPQASDRAGRRDAALDALNARAFTANRACDDAAALVSALQAAFVHDVCGMSNTVRAQHRHVGTRHVYMVMDAAPGDVVEFRCKGRVELWDPWTGESAPLRVIEETETGTRVELPLQAYEAQVIVFTPGETHIDPPAQETAPQTEITLPDAWQVQFEPTMDNSHGDFRLPLTDVNQTIGIEARRFAWARETDELADTAMLPQTDDTGWCPQLHGHGPQFYLLGPVPEDTDPQATDAALAACERVDPTVPLRIDGRDYHWQPYNFSWRYGVEGDPGHQGFHGLKGTISEHFIRLGKFQVSNTGARTLIPDTHSRYYLWTTVAADAPVTATLHISTEQRDAPINDTPVSAPAALFLNGTAIEDTTQPVQLQSGPNPLLLRFDDWGQAHVVLRRHGAPSPDDQTPVAMCWYRDPGVLPFDVYAGDARAEWFRFVTAPGTTDISLDDCGPAQAWIDGQPMLDRGQGRFEAPQASRHAAVVALRLKAKPGCSGGALIPEPIRVDTDGSGLMSLGDWSHQGILNNYSGGVLYRTVVTLTSDQAAQCIEIDLGTVVATAEVHINGELAGISVAPPWRQNIAGLLREGENKIEIRVYNTLANHYQTIPSLYPGTPTSGLMGPVRLLA